MPLPHFLVLLCVVVLAAGATIWIASHAGVPDLVLATAALLAAAAARLFMKVER